jgi:hypothetical protein
MINYDENRAESEIFVISFSKIISNLFSMRTLYMWFCPGKTVSVVRQENTIPVLSSSLSYALLLTRIRSPFL